MTVKKLAAELRLKQNSALDDFNKNAPKAEVTDRQILIATIKSGVEGGNNRLSILGVNLKNLTALPDLSLFTNFTTVELRNLTKLISFKATQLPAKLKSLNIHHTAITNIPPDIAELTKLERLYFDHNQLTRLPPEIGKLIGLKSLDLSENQIAELPATIGKLINLEELNLANNVLSTIPEDTIANLRCLEYFYLNNNSLTALPTNICKLTSLKYLDLNNNRLRALPTDICKLISLTYLDLNNNSLTALPTAIGNLSKLIILKLNNNRLNTFDLNLFTANRSTLLRIYLKDNYFSEVMIESLTTTARQLRSINLHIDDNIGAISKVLAAEQAIFAWLSFDIDTLKFRSEYLNLGNIFIKNAEKYKNINNTNHQSTREIIEKILNGLNSDEKENLSKILSRLINIKDLISIRNEQQLAYAKNSIKSIQSMLENMSKNQDFKTKMIAQAMECLSSCDDNIARFLLEIHQSQLVFAFNQNPAAKKPANFEILKKAIGAALAQKIIQILLGVHKQTLLLRGKSFTEDVEAYLALYTKLARIIKPLMGALPIKTMLFEQCANFTEPARGTTATTKNSDTERYKALFMQIFNAKAKDPEQNKKIINHLMTSLFDKTNGLFPALSGDNDNKSALEVTSFTDKNIKTIQTIRSMIIDYQKKLAKIQEAYLADNNLDKYNKNLAALNLIQRSYWGFIS